MRGALRQIRRRHWEPLTLAGVAAELDVRMEYLGALFRREARTTFTRRLRKARLRAAARRIRAGEKIDAVALLVGSRSKKNLYVQFRRTFGLTPAEYRSRVRGR